MEKLTELVELCFNKGNFFIYIANTNGQMVVYGRDERELNLEFIGVLTHIKEIHCHLTNSIKERQVLHFYLVCLRKLLIRELAMLCAGRHLILRMFLLFPTDLAVRSSLETSTE